MSHLKVLCIKILLEFIEGEISYQLKFKMFITSITYHQEEYAVNLISN